MDKENEIIIDNGDKNWNSFICSKVSWREEHHAKQNKLCSGVNSIHTREEMESSVLKAKEWTLEFI